MKILATLSLIVFFMAPAAGIQLRFWPPSQLIDLSESGSLSVMLDDVIDLRTVELWVSYNDLILQSSGGGPGGLFEDTGCMTWWDLEDMDPGSWHGFAVILDAYCWATGPGELFHWDFVGLAEGYSRIQVDNIRLFDENGDLIEGVTLADTFVFVGGDITSVPSEDTQSRNWGILKSLY
ncbi:hypothetical protein H8E52_07895 [bacterium]|nr:hypothetical protein [bacterium]